jgi:hypothetical protein
VGFQKVFRRDLPDLFWVPHDELAPVEAIRMVGRPNHNPDHILESSIEQYTEHIKYKTPACLNANPNTKKKKERKKDCLFSQQQHNFTSTILDLYCIIMDGQRVYNARGVRGCSK